MRRLPGQAALGAGMLLHWLATLAITVAVLAGTALGAIAWRLSQGPMDMPWLTHRLEMAANANGGPTRLSIGTVALAWEGFSRGVDRPLELRVTGITIADNTGRRRMSIPSAEVSLSLYELLFGRVALRAVDVEGARLTLMRAADGALSVDVGSLNEATDADQPAAQDQAAPVADVLAELAKPRGGDGDRASTLFGQLRVVRINDASVVVIDRQLGVTWRAPRAEIDLRRLPTGGAEGSAELSLAVGGQTARLTLSATLSAGAAETHLRARLSPITPSVVAAASPSLAFLSVLDAPVGADARFDLDSRLVPRQVHFDLQAGAGKVRIGGGEVGFIDAALAASATPDALSINTFRVTLRGHDGGPLTHLAAQGSVERQPDHLTTALSLDLDQVEFADLPRLWPDGIGNHARDWLLENITSGVARNGHVNVELAASPDLSSIELTRASGTLDGDGLQVSWLRPIPPIENGKAQLRILDPDTLEIAVASGRQAQSGRKDTGSGGLQIRGGTMRITGMMQPRQFGSINADIAGSLPDAIALLREPRLQLLDRHPLPLNNPSGQASVKLSITLPLQASVRMDDVAIRAQAHLENVHLGGVAVGRDLDQGALDLDVTADGLKLNGHAALAAIPADLEAVMDFRAGPPAQVLQTITVSGRPDASQLTAAGLDVTPLLSGATQMKAILVERRNGSGDLSVTSDLTSAELTVAPLEWRKPRSAQAKATARLVLDHDRLVRIDNIRLDGDDVVLRGQCTLNNDRLSLIQVERLVLGRTAVQGTVKFPDQPGTGAIAVNISGTTLDVAQRLSRRVPPHRHQAVAEPPPGPRWTLDARLGQLLMARNTVAQDVVLHAQNDGRVFQQLHLEGQTAAHAPFLVEITPGKTGRHLIANAADAGDLLRGLDYVPSVEGGHLSLKADYDDRSADRPLTGTMDVTDFRMRDAPVMGKLLQAMTLYGVVEALRGPGLGFNHLEVPFRLTDAALDISDARAFSSSLGLTAKGHIDLDEQQVDLQGTIVPAYFFNSLLGNVPLLGKLFSPERGGGVFAASYAVHGSLDNPSVSVNPLAALTPGFLRGLFKLF